MSTFKLNQFGYWERETKMFPYLAKIRPDKCLKSLEIRKKFQPNSLVEYDLMKIYKEEIDDEVIYMASVTKFEDEDKENYPIPLCMLMLSEKQKEEIIRVRHFPKKAFEKATVIKNEIDVDAFVPVEFFEDEIS